jgi:hypothetical protein
VSVQREALGLVREGHDLHYGSGDGAAGSISADPDLALLDGDRLYAQGLERLAEAGDLATIAELADLISACARAAAEGRPEEAERAWSAVTRRHGADSAR